MHARRSTHVLTLFIGTAAAVYASAKAQAQPAAHAADHTPVALIDRTLSPRQATVIELIVSPTDPGFVRYLDGQGIIRQAQLNDVAALVRRSWLIDEHSAFVAPSTSTEHETTPTSMANTPMLRLIDGQAIPGRLVSDRDEHDELIRWQHPLLGFLTVQLEQIDAMVLDPAAADNSAVPAVRVDDTVALVNGDVLAGFVESIGSQVRIDTDGSVLEINSDQVAGVYLANAAEQPTGLTMVLDDGAAVRLNSIITSNDGSLWHTQLALAERSDDAPIGVPIGRINALIPDAAQVRSLAELSLSSATPSDELFPSTPIVHSGASGSSLADTLVTLPAPMTLTWMLPDGATRVAGWVELPPGAWTWGDCEIVVTALGCQDVLGRFALSADQPRIRFDVKLPGDCASLLISLSPGRFGPVQDHVVLRNVLVLIEP